MIRLQHLSTRKARTEVGLSSFFSNFPCLCFYAIAPLTKRRVPSTPYRPYLVFLSCQSFFWCTCEVFLPICSPLCRYCPKCILSFVWQILWLWHVLYAATLIFLCPFGSLLAHILMQNCVWLCHHSITWYLHAIASYTVLAYLYQGLRQANINYIPINALLIYMWCGPLLWLHYMTS